MDTRVLAVFEGIHLLLMNEQTVWQPDGGLLEISFCTEGRREYSFGTQCYYLSEGSLMIRQCSDHEAQPFYPSEHYQGLTFLIDPAAAQNAVSGVLAEQEFRIGMLLSKFCSGQGCSVCASEQISALFAELADAAAEYRMDRLKVGVLALLVMLRDLDGTCIRTEQFRCSEVRAQLAKEANAFACKRLNERSTIGQIAEHFRVSPTHLKESYRFVYGCSMYANVRAQKMRIAAQLLRETDRTVLDIAGEIGYDNGSKFAKAFREVIGKTPRAYRQTYRLEQIIETE